MTRALLVSLLALHAASCAGARRGSAPTRRPPAVVAEPVDPEDDATEAVRSTPCGMLRSERRCLVEGMSALGVDRGEAHFDERPAHAVRVARIVIDRREVTRADWHRCVRAGRCAEPSCPSPSGRAAVRCVSWPEARAYCAYRRGRLPSEAEWERAARGLLPSTRRYVWGEAMPEAGVPRDRTDEGVQDLAGGVAEWTEDGGDFYPSLPRLSDGGVDGGADVPPQVDGLFIWEDAGGPAASPWRVVRGGDEGTPLDARTATLRRFRQPDDRLPWVGFRCVYDPAR